MVVPFVFYLLLVIEQEKEDMLRLLRLVPAQAQFMDDDSTGIPFVSYQ